VSEAIRPGFRIVILGGGTAGWMAANLLAARWPQADISVVEAPDIGIIGVGEGSTPQLKAFFDGLGVAETDWMPACNATYKNGISFHGWSDRPGHSSYFHPFPAPIDVHTSPAFFFHSHYRRHGYDLNADPDRFFLSAWLARHGKAPIPAENFPFEMAYGYHFDAYRVGAFLRDHARTLGVGHIEARIAAAVLAETGDIAALKADDGREIAGDFFIDSSGFRSALLQETLKVKFRSFADNLFNDAAIVMPTPPDPARTNSHTRATAMKHGWAWDIPLTNRSGNGYVYASRYVTADEAETELRAHLGLLDSDVEARRLTMRVGRVEAPWRRNCLAVGLSQGFIEPLEATALHLVQATVEGFMTAFEKGGATSAEERAFNAEINARFEGVRDYIVCHYRANLRGDTAYWRDNAANDALSDSLRRILACWFSRGDMKREIADQGVAKYYSLTSWLCLLGGYGNYPRADGLAPPPPELRRFEMVKIDDFIRRCAYNFRDHKSVLAAMTAG